MRAWRPKVKSDYSRSAIAKRWVFLLLPTRLSVFLFRTFLDSNRERNTLEAAKFLIDTANIYPSKLFWLQPKFLRFSLALGESNLPKSYIQFLSKSLLTTRRDPSQRRGVREAVLGATKLLDHSSTSAHSWKMISLALSGFGFVRAGTIARNNCLKQACEEVSAGVATNRTLHLAIRGLLEARRFDEAKKVIDEKLRQLSGDSEIDIYRHYLALMAQTPLTISQDNNQPIEPAEKIFEDLVTDKTVALIAPGVMNSESGADIDAHDTVFRIKYNGRSAMPEEKFVGRRCDITSHNSDLLSFAQIDSTKSQEMFQDAPDLKLIVAKRGSFGGLLGLPSHTMRMWPPTFLTTGTSGTLSIFEVVLSSPKKLSLFGFDFYTNKAIYNTALLHIYQSSVRPDGALPNELSWDQNQFATHSVARSHISHDLKSDFLFVKNLYELSGLIDGTPEVLEILNLTADEYDMRLEEVLGDW